MERTFVRVPTLAARRGPERSPCVSAGTCDRHRSLANAVRRLQSTFLPFTLGSLSGTWDPFDLARAACCNMPWTAAGDGVSEACFAEVGATGVAAKLVVCLNVTSAATVTEACKVLLAITA